MTFQSERAAVTLELSEHHTNVLYLQVFLLLYSPNLYQWSLAAQQKHFSVLCKAIQEQTTSSKMIIINTCLKLFQKKKLNRGFVTGLHEYMQTQISDRHLE